MLIDARRHRDVLSLLVRFMLVTVLDCGECIPGILVCDVHLVPCGGECLICCSLCLRVLCDRHMYCPCPQAIERRRVAVEKLRLGNLSRVGSLTNTDTESKNLGM